MVWKESAKSFGQQHADRLIRRFDAVFRTVERFPALGFSHPDLPPGLRMHPLSRYPFIVFYEVKDSDTIIVRLLHEKRKRDSLQ